MTTVRLSGCSGLEVLKSLAEARCCSLTGAWPRASPTGAGCMSGPSCAATAVRMTSGGIISACCIWGDMSLGSVRTDILCA